jgi:hypothetical protein
VYKTTYGPWVFSGRSFIYKKTKEAKEMRIAVLHVSSPCKKNYIYSV